MIKLIDINDVVDGLGKGWDEQIKRPVQILMTLGYETTQSCEGHSDWGLPYPWIQINGNSDKMFALIREYDVDYNCNLVIEDSTKSFRIVGSNYVKYDMDLEAHRRAWSKNWDRPEDEMKTLIEGINNDQKDMQNFCEWLLNEETKKQAL